MSTDLVPTTAQLFRARRDLDHERVLRQQAEDAQRTAEEEARRAEERATQAGEDRDGWANFARALASYHLIDQYASDRLTDDARIVITEDLYDQWTHGTPVHDLTAEALVNGFEGQ